MHEDLLKKEGTLKKTSIHTFVSLLRVVCHVRYWYE